MATTSAIDLRSLEQDPRLFLYTSLTAGSSHIITATSRMETILKANRIPFQAIDIATDEKARRLWQRRGGKKKLPGLVKDGYVIGDLAEVEEWNEFGELKENIGPVPAGNVAPPGGLVGVNTAPPTSFSGGSISSTEKLAQPITDTPGPTRVLLPAMAQIAAMNKAQAEALAAQRAKEKEEAQRQKVEATKEAPESTLEERTTGEAIVPASNQKAESIDSSKAASSSETEPTEPTSVEKHPPPVIAAKVASPIEEAMAEKFEEDVSKIAEVSDEPKAEQEGKQKDVVQTKETEVKAKNAEEGATSTANERSTTGVDLTAATKGIQAVQITDDSTAQEQAAADVGDNEKSTGD